MPKTIQELVKRGKKELDIQHGDGAYPSDYWITEKILQAYRAGAEAMRDAIRLNIKTPAAGGGSGPTLPSANAGYNQASQEANEQAKVFLSTLNPPNL